MRIVVVSGSSGGHIFPALSFIESLKQKCYGTEVLLILPANAIKGVVAVSCPVKYLTILSFSLKLDSKNLKAMLDSITGSCQAFLLLLKFKPDAVVGFGSFSSLPVIFFAWLLRIKTLIHEQNVIPGRANKLLSKITDKVAVSFQESSAYFHVDRRKIILTGNPIRRELSFVGKPQALDYFGLAQDKFTILVAGGSQGSHSINMEFAGFLSRFRGKSNIQVIHLSGKKDYEFLNSVYKNSGVAVKLFAFLDPMQYAYSACDLIVSRAGAATITEVINFKIPAVLVPYPYAYQHQSANARVLQRKGCATVINDKDLNPLILEKVIEPLVDHPENLRKMRDSYSGGFLLDSPGLLADAVVSLVKDLS